MMTTIETESTPITVSRLVGAGVLVAAVAVVLNGLVRVSAMALLDLPVGIGPLGWGPVINTTVVGVAGATAVYGFLTRVSNRPTRHFTTIALVVLLLSLVPLLVPPPFLAGAPRTVLGTLAIMHVTTAAVVVTLLPRLSTGWTIP